MLNEQSMAETVDLRTPLEAVTDIVPEQNWTEPPRRKAGWIPQLQGLIGQRRTEDGVVACSLEDMAIIDEEIAHTVLADEHVRTPLIYVVPYPEISKARIRGGTSDDEATKILANNDKWLISIAGEEGEDGHWPMPMYLTEDGQGLEADRHDTSDWHVIFMMIAPAEMQAEISKAARHGIIERLETLDDPDRKGAAFEGPDRSETSPGLNIIRLPDSSRFSFHDKNAVSIIDSVSDGGDLPRLMNTLLELESAEQRDAYLDRYETLANMSHREAHTWLSQTKPEGVDKNVWLDEEYQKRREQMLQIMGGMVKIANFNMRYEENRNLNADEQQAVVGAYLQGIRRVAHKLAGDGQLSHGSNSGLELVA